MKLTEVFAQYASAEAVFQIISEKLQKLASERPDYQYTYSDKLRCAYNGPPKRDPWLYPPIEPSINNCDMNAKGCIFGVLLQEMGWSDKEELETDMSIQALLKESLNLKDGNITQLLRFRDIQCKQDGGATWGEAVGLLES
jgi:hypothetical protein